MPQVPFKCGRPKPSSEECRWRIHWRSVHGRCCYYPEFPKQTVSLKRCSTQGCRPGRGRGPEPASGGLGGISCGSSGLSRSRRCSWGNRWRLAATPPQTRSTLVRCYLRPLWDRTHGDWSEDKYPQHGNTRLNEKSGWPLIGLYFFLKRVITETGSSYGWFVIIYLYTVN